MHSLIYEQNDRSLPSQDLKLFSKIVYKCQPLVVVPVEYPHFLFGDRACTAMTSAVTIAKENYTDGDFTDVIADYLKRMFNDGDIIVILSYNIEPVTNGIERGYYIRLRFAHIEREE